MIIVGLLAATLTTSAFLPQMIKTWRTKSAKDVSYTMLITFIIGIFLWLIYGILRKDIAIILANAFTLLFNLTILYLKIKYGRTPQSKRL
ncbi:SemiSWEET transporter [Plectonema cf. radiosum LEGE 06105]|uniref:SemiSWEET transporter n=2 Tax=Plectonema TaxID=1183 RepID=A0A8J7JXQ7_9CYAN|nr:SemiSWEET transporter [Plectonema cf. radiosum LEGE 06105]